MPSSKFYSPQSLGLLSIFFLLIMFIVPVLAQSSSAGCANINSVFWDDSYGSATMPAFSFYENEQIIVNAIASTSTTDSLPTLLTLIEGGVVVDTVSFPGTAAFTVSTDSELDFEWRLDAGTATFSVSCETSNNSQSLDMAGASSDSILYLSGG